MEIGLIETALSILKEVGSYAVLVFLSLKIIIYQQTQIDKKDTDLKDRYKNSLDINERSIKAIENNTNMLGDIKEILKNK